MAQDVAITPKTLHKSHADDVLLTRPRQALSKDVLQTAHGGELSAIAAYLADSDQVRPARFSSEEDPRGSAAGSDATLPAIGRQRSISYQSIMAGVSSEGVVGRADAEGEIERAIVDAMARYSKRPASTSFQFVNPASHYFFYRKPHEHVPGIMLLEAARQTIYYQLYGYTKRRLGEVTVSLSEVTAHFHHYAELMYPIEVIVDDLASHHSEKPSLVHYLTSFYQRNRLIAEVESKAPVIALQRFELARNANLLSNTLFAPLPGAPILTIITSADGQANIVVLKHVSAAGCVTGLPALCKGEAALITLVFASTLVFTCEASVQSLDAREVHWTFVELKFDQRETLKEIVKRGFVAITSV